FVAEPARLPTPLNMFSLLFDPHLVRPFVTDWAHVGQRMIGRLHRETLQGRPDDRLRALIQRTLAYPDVPPDWRRPDFSAHGGSTLEIQLCRGDLRVGFLTTITMFSAPQQVTLDELRIESYFPLDEATRSTCTRLADYL